MKQNQCKYCTNGTIFTPVKDGHFKHGYYGVNEFGIRTFKTILNLKNGQSGKCPFCKPDKY